MAVGSILGMLVVLVVARVLWQVLASPLSAFPGPFTARFTDIRRAIAAASGHIDDVNRKWHKQYGTAVRIGPNTISFSDPNLIKTIYATKNAWRKVQWHLQSQLL